MIVIVALDDRGGMMFNHRRQSQDKVLRERVLKVTAGKKLWMNHYTEKQFPSAHKSMCPTIFFLRLGRGSIAS